MAAPSICGGFLSDKRSMVAFAWSITTALTLFAFLTAIVLAIQIHGHYRHLKRYYGSDDWYQQYIDDYANDEQGGGSHDQYEEYQNQAKAYLQLSKMSEGSMTFVAVYTMMLATGLSLYGSTAIVGFTSLRGVYIAPCFSTGSSKLKVGMFGGALVVFANLLVVCAVILGEVRVRKALHSFRCFVDPYPYIADLLLHRLSFSPCCFQKVDDDRRDRQDQDEMEPYQVERIATLLAVTCMFLSALYTIFAVLLFLCFTSDEVLLDVDDDAGGTHPKTPLVSVNTRTITPATPQLGQLGSPAFITMENSSQASQGTA